MNIEEVDVGRRYRIRHPHPGRFGPVYLKVKICGKNSESTNPYCIHVQTEKGRTMMIRPSDVQAVADDDDWYHPSDEPDDQGEFNL